MTCHPSRVRRLHGLGIALVAALACGCHHRPDALRGPGAYTLVSTRLLPMNVWLKALASRMVLCWYRVRTITAVDHDTNVTTVSTFTYDPQWRLHQLDVSSGSCSTFTYSPDVNPTTVTQTVTNCAGHTVDTVVYTLDPATGNATIDSTGAKYHYDPTNLYLTSIDYPGYVFTRTWSGNQITNESRVYPDVSNNVTFTYAYSTLTPDCRELGLDFKGVSNSYMYDSMTETAGNGATETTNYTYTIDPNTGQLLNDTATGAHNVDRTYTYY